MNFKCHDSLEIPLAFTLVKGSENSIGKKILFQENFIYSSKSEDESTSGFLPQQTWQRQDLE